MKAAALTARLSPSQVAGPRSVPGLGTAGPLLQRKCQCGSTAPASASGTCTQCEDDKRLQKKLAIGSSADPLEHEADRIADLVLAAPGWHGTTRPALPHVQRLAARPAREVGGVPASVEHVLASPGQPLDPALALDMGERFGHDFARVRLHADSAAAEAARAVGARAFTVGHHIAFGDGELARGGLRLLAHELTHTIQQGAASSVGRPASRRPAVAQGLQAGVLQRQDAKETKTDVAIVLADDDISLAEGGALAPVVLRVKSLANLCKQIDNVGKPIGTLFVVSHADGDGVLRITGEAGQIRLTMNDLASALKKCKRIPGVVDFRGCQAGASAEVDKFVDVSGVSKAVATNCSKFSQRTKPITVDGVPATLPSQGPTTQKGKAEFDAALLTNVRNMVAANNRSVSHCLVGLPSRAPTNNDLPVLRKLYWANKGQLVASWASPVDNHDWQKDSRCMKDLTPSTSPCRRVEKEAPKKEAAKPKSAAPGSNVMPPLVLGPGADPEESRQ